jgi:hypothetical protein
MLWKTRGLPPRPLVWTIEFSYAPIYGR